MRKSECGLRNDLILEFLKSLSYRGGLDGADFRFNTNNPLNSKQFKGLFILAA